MDASFLEKYVDLLKNLPSDVKRYLKLISTIDTECEEVAKQRQQLTCKICERLQVRSPFPNNVHAYLGVKKSQRGDWIVQIYDYKSEEFSRFGPYDSMREAAQEYDRYIIDIRGFNSVTNFKKFNTAKIEPESEPKRMKINPKVGKITLLDGDVPVPQEKLDTINHYDILELDRMEKRLVDLQQEKLAVVRQNIELIRSFQTKGIEIANRLKLFTVQPDELSADFLDETAL